MVYFIAATCTRGGITVASPVSAVEIQVSRMYLYLRDFSCSPHVPSIKYLIQLTGLRTKYISI